MLLAALSLGVLIVRCFAIHCHTRNGTQCEGDVCSVYANFLSDKKNIYQQVFECPKSSQNPYFFLQSCLNDVEPAYQNGCYGEKYKEQPPILECRWLEATVVSTFSLSIVGNENTDSAFHSA